MCQMNLEGYQEKVSGPAGQKLGITVIYLPQLLGLALGISPDRLGLDLNLALRPEFLAKLPAAQQAA
jgi:heterodisulfide reductase subunit B